MTQIRRIGIGTAVLLCIAVGLFLAAILPYVYWGPGSENYSYWTRRWIFTVGLVFVGIIARIVLIRRKENSRKYADGNATRKT